MIDAAPSSILLVRDDGIGDNILFSAMIPHLAARFPGARLAVVCQEPSAPLYEHCPFISRTIAFNKPRAVSDTAYRAQLLEQLRDLNPGLCINTVLSRDEIGDELSLNCGAPQTIAFRGSANNVSPQAMAASNARYGHLIETSPQWWMPELDRLGDFLIAIDAPTQPMSTHLWTSSQDRRAAEELIQQHGLGSRPFITLFATATFAYKNYERFGQALGTICREQGLGVLALGTDRDYATNQRCLDVMELGVNLCGQTTLRQSAEIIRMSGAAVGIDTGLTHVACAVGTPNVIVLGGGHFGRFLPYSPLTSVVTLPLDCFGCSWRCRYLWPHCVKDVAPEVVELAVREALAARSDKSRVYFQDRSLWTRPPGGPNWSLRGDLLPQQLVQINLATNSTITRKFRQPFIGPWIKGMTRALLRPIARAFR